jgi:hypothetical protein
MLVLMLVLVSAAAVACYALQFVCTDDTYSKVCMPAAAMRCIRRLNT